MAAMTTPSGQLGTIACCMCGVAMTPNDANMCLDCLKDRVDVTEGISKNEVIWNCSSCARYRPSTEGRWLKCEPESAELLALCLKSVHGLGKGKGKSLKGGAKFVDASWIWTEPHSKRLKVKVTVEKEVFNQATIRQVMVVEFVIRSRLCDFCVKETTDQNWTTIVQVRQQVKYKRTLLNLENRIVRDGAASKCMNVVPVATGIDFYFANKNAAIKFSEHVLNCVPARRKDSKSLKGSDLNSNKYNFRHTIHVEVVPICKNDFVLLPTKLQAALFGGKCAGVLCESVTRHVNLINPFTLEKAKLSEAKYWQNEFKSLANAKEMVEFSVLDVQPLDYSTTSLLAEVEVARACDLGVNDDRFIVHSHIGAYLQPGDTVLGYDFTNSIYGEDVLEPLKGKELPTIVLVQKVNERKKEKSDRAKEKPKKKKKSSKSKKGISRDYRNQADDSTLSVAESSAMGDDDFNFDENEDFDISEDEGLGDVVEEGEDGDQGEEGEQGEEEVECLDEDVGEDNDVDVEVDDEKLLVGDGEGEGKGKAGDKVGSLQHGIDDMALQK